MQANKRLATDTQAPLGLRFCRVCLSEDYRDGRESHWRRSHQLPGVNICHIHRCILTEGSTDLSYAHDVFLSLARLMDENHPVSDICVKANYHMIEDLSIASHEFLIGSVNQSETASRVSFFKIVAEAGWRYKGYADSLNRRRLNEKILQAYGPDVLGDIGVSHAVFRPSFGSTSRRNSTDWLLECLNRRGKMVHPLPYLLIMLALKISTSKLFRNESHISLEASRKKSIYSAQFGQCINPLCSRFKSNMEYQESPSAAKVSRIINCDECGYTYRMSGTTGKLRFRRILSYGWVWDQALIEECMIGACNYTELRQRFGSCIQNIKRRALQLKVWHPRWNKVEKGEAQKREERNLFKIESQISLEESKNNSTCSDQFDRCINPLCICFETDTKHQEGSIAGKVSRIIKCDECGYTYRIPGGTGKLRFRRILSYGWIWDQALIEECMVGRYNNTELTQRFGSCIPNIKKRALQLNIWHPRWIKFERDKAQVGEERKWVSKRTAKTEKMRMIWLAAASINPEAGRVEISKREQSAYTFLRRWDREWLHKTTPLLKVKRRSLYDLYSSQEDQALADRIYEIAKQIVCLVPPKRVTRPMIMRELGSTVINFKVASLTRARHALSECVETAAEFCRRCSDGSGLSYWP